MRVLYLHRTRGTGVEAVHIRGIVDAFRKLGHDVFILSPNGLHSGNEGEAKTRDTAGGDTSPSFMANFSRVAPEFLFECAELGYNIPGFATALAVAKRLRCDFIFERYALFGAVGALLAVHLSLPWVLEVNYTSQNRLVRQRSKALGPLAKLIELKVFPRCTGIVTVSSSLKDHLVRDYSLHPEKIVVLPNAADPDVFHPEVHPQQNCGGYRLDGECFGFVGGFYPWHGLDLLLDAFLSLWDSFPNAKLLLIGDGPEKARLLSRVKEAGAQGRVYFAGKVPHNDLPKWISAFHVGVMPDSNEYGSPMKIFEYMSMGKPVIVPDYLPLRDAVDDQVEGMIFAPGNIEALAGQMRRLLGDPALYGHMAEAARRRVIFRHNWEQNARTILETFS